MWVLSADHEEGFGIKFRGQSAIHLQVGSFLRKIKRHISFPHGAENQVYGDVDISTFLYFKDLFSVCIPEVTFTRTKQL
jgi:hypothetical protein